MTTVWPSRKLRFGRSRRTRRGSDDGMEKAPPTVRRWGRVPPPRAGFRVPWFPSGVPRAAEHGNGRHHAKGRRTDPPQGERCRPFPVPMPGVEPGAVLPKVVKGDFQGAGRSGAQGKGVADRIRPHWIRPATPFWFPWCAGRGSRGVPMPGVEPGAVLPKVVKGDFQGAGRPRRGSWAWGGAPRGRQSSRRDGSRRDVVSDGRQSLSSVCGALRRRETAMRAAPPPSTTTAANAISAMPAPVWARLLR